VTYGIITPMLVYPEILGHVKSITGFLPLGQPTLIHGLQGIPTLDDSTTKGHYTNSNLDFKASIRECNSAPDCYHDCIWGNIWLQSFLKLVK
jgi:hypothetical protein